MRTILSSGAKRSRTSYNKFMVGVRVVIAIPDLCNRRNDREDREEFRWGRKEVEDGEGKLQRL